MHKATVPAPAAAAHFPPLPPGPPPHFPPLPLGAPPPLPQAHAAQTFASARSDGDDQPGAARPPPTHAWPHEVLGRGYADERASSPVGIESAWTSPTLARRAPTDHDEEWPPRRAAQPSARTPLDSLEEVLLHHVVALRKGELRLSSSSEGQRTAHSALALCEQLAILIRSQLHPQHTEMGGAPGWGEYTEYPLSMELASSLQHLLADSEPRAAPPRQTLAVATDPWD